MHIRRTDSRKIAVWTTCFATVCAASFLVAGDAGLYLSLVFLFAAICVGLVKLYRLLQHENKLVVSQVDSLLTLQEAVPELQFLSHPVGWTANLDLLREIAEKVHSNRPGVVVELGSGLSTIYMATIMKSIGVGSVLSFDHDPAYAEKTRTELARRGLSEIARVVTVDLVEQTVNGDTYRWYNISREPLPDVIDMLVVDGPPLKTQKLARYPALPMFDKNLSDKAVVILDDANRPDEATIVALWKQQHGSFSCETRFGAKGLAVFTRRTERPAIR